MRSILFIITCILYLPATRAQPHYAHFQEYGTRDGFDPFDISGKVVKDHDGFLWIGSDNGLFRFDGQNFKVFRNNKEDSTSILSDNIYSPFIAHDGSLWLNTGLKGISLFDPVTQGFRPWVNNNKREINIAFEHVVEFFEDSRKNLWLIVAGKGIARMDKTNKTVKLFSFKKDTAQQGTRYTTSFINNIVEDNTNYFWLSTHNGLIRFNAATGDYNIYRDPAPVKKDESRHTLITDVFCDSSGVIWAGTWGAGLKTFDPVTQQWNTYKWNTESNIPTKNIVHSIVQKNTNELLVATADAKLLVFYISTKTFAPVLSLNANLKDGIYVVEMFADKAGYIWCTGGKTLVKIHVNNIPFRYQPLVDNPLYGTGAIAGNTFLKLPGNGPLYVGIYYSKGLYIQDKAGGELKNYPRKLIKGFSENINQFLLDRDSNLWVCFNTGVYIFDTKKKQFHALPSTIKNHSLLQSPVFAAVEDEDGSIWFASRTNGLLRYDKNTGEILPFQSVNEKLSNDNILSLIRDSKGNIWFGSHKHSGVGCIIKGRKEVKIYDFATYGIPQISVSGIQESMEGDIFFSLDHYGLGVIRNPLSGRDSFTRFSNHDGIQGSRVYGLGKDKIGNIWLATNNGLNKCRTRDLNFTAFTVADGLYYNAFDVNLYCDLDGIMYAGTPGGYIYFDPATVNRNSEVPRIIIHTFKINGKEYKGDINTVGQLSLNYHEANFTFEYAPLIYRDNMHLRYSYRLKGLDKDWRYTDKQRIGAYSLSHGGTYTLQIRSSNANGEWNDDKIKELTIIVSPPFWEEWWFIASCVLVALTGLYIFIRRRIKTIRAAEEKKTYLHKIQAEAEMKALRAQMNPHFIFNCMNTIDAYIHKNNPEAASEFLHKFSQLIRQILENSQYAAIPLKKDMDALELYIELEEQRHGFRFTHKIQIPDNVLQKGYKIPPLLVQPYVENAILHGLRHKENGQGLLSVSFEENNNQLICLVEDNGIGRKASERIYEGRNKDHRSLGLKVSRERIESLNDISPGTAEVVIIDKENGSGTLVKLNLPKIVESQ